MISEPITLNQLNIYIICNLNEITLYFVKHLVRVDKEPEWSFNIKTYYF